MFLEFITALLLFACCQAAGIKPRHRYRYGDTGWPEEQVWRDFNSSISGRLVRTFPSAAVCHNSQFDDALCTEARQEWENSFWRTNQTGAYTAMAWELGAGQCFIDSSRAEACDQGLGWYNLDQLPAIILITENSSTLLSCCTIYRRCPGCGQICQRKGFIPRGQEYRARPVRTPHVYFPYHDKPLTIAASGVQAAPERSPSGPITSRAESGLTITLWKVHPKAPRVSRPSRSKLESNGLVGPSMVFYFYYSAHLPVRCISGRCSSRGDCSWGPCTDRWCSRRLAHWWRPFCLVKSVWPWCGQ